jgi:hypothetical protein
LRPVGAPERGPARGPATFKQIAKIRPWSGLIRRTTKEWATLAIRLRDRPLTGRGGRQSPSAGQTATYNGPANGPAHKFTPAKDSKALTAPLRNFLRSSFEPATIWSRRRGDWNGRRRLRLGLDEAQNPRKRNESFAKAKRTISHAWSQAIRIISREITPFREIVCIHELNRLFVSSLSQPARVDPKSQTQRIVKRSARGLLHIAVPL